MSEIFHPPVLTSGAVGVLSHLRAALPHPVAVQSSIRLGVGGWSGCGRFK